MTLKTALKKAQTKANIYRRDFYVYNMISTRNLDKVSNSFFEIWPYPLRADVDIYTICPE